MEELSHSLSLSLSLSLTHKLFHSPTYIQQRAHSLTFHSHTQRGEHTHSTSSQRFEGILTPTLCHTQIGGHIDSLTISLSLSLSHPLTHSLTHSLLLSLTLTHSLSLSHNGGTLSLSLSLSPINSLTLLHTYSRGRTH